MNGHLIHDGSNISYQGDALADQLEQRGLQNVDMIESIRSKIQDMQHYHLDIAWWRRPEE